MTVVPTARAGWVGRASRAVGRTSLAGRALNRLSPEVTWLRPNGRNRRDLLGLTRTAREAGWPHVEFMIHSSELMPGGSPYFRSRRSVEGLYADLEALFAYVATGFCPVTLAEFHAGISRAAPRS